MCTKVPLSIFVLLIQDTVIFDPIGLTIGERTVRPKSPSGGLNLPKLVSDPRRFSSEDK